MIWESYDDWGTRTYLAENRARNEQLDAEAESARLTREEKDMYETAERLLLVIDSVARYLRHSADQVDALARERGLDPFLAGAARHGFESAAKDLETRQQAP